MSLTAGIVGLPNVGKSTLFNAITKKNILAANYPFATIDPNVGIVVVPDNRLTMLESMYAPEDVIPTSFEFRDIAGLVKGASLGEGLGNKFLSHIREVDAICEVVRCFEDSEIIHVENSVDPKRDIEIINLELVLADLEVVENRLGRIEKKAMTTKDKDSLAELSVLRRIKEALLKDIPTRKLEYTEEESLIIKSFHLLTAKPIIYLANIKESDIGKNNNYVDVVREIARSEGSEVIEMCAKVESELSELNDEDKALFLEELGIKESGLDRLIRATYNLLGLATFFTCGPKEVKAWTFRKGMKAPACAGIIHTDFERGFIRAEVIGYDDLIACGGEKEVKENGKMRLEGKDYIMQDGDICHFRFNV
jgi:GTP-binding protein YchF